jgi:ribosome-associated protein
VSRSAEIRQAVRALSSFSFSRSGGPGGQNVNKLNTKVTARFVVRRLSFLSEGELRGMEERLGGRVSAEGEITVSVQDTREQARNREIAVERISQLIERALEKPKRRVKTRPSFSSREARLSAKRHKARLKSLRGGGVGED